MNMFWHGVVTVVIGGLMALCVLAAVVAILVELFG